MLIKVLAAEGDLSSASNVNTATVVRLFNNHSAALVITRKDSGGTTIGSFTLAGNEVAYVEKVAADTLEGGTNIKAAKIAYGN